MNYSTYRITLDVRKTVSNVQLTAKKGDAGRKVYITLSDKGNPCEIADGLYAVFAGVKPDGTLLYNKTTIENNTIIYEMTQQTTAVPGLVACEVKLFDSMSNLLTSPKLTILVDDVVVPDEEIVSQNEITALAELILDATASSHFATEAANAAIAAAGNAQAATESANGAAASANQATEGAITAASNANTAAGKATTEAGKATQATEKANLATTNANNAASDARAATEETNTARENIVQTTGEILTSLSNAVYAPPVECSAAGEVVAVNDASNQLLHGLHIYGKTTQNGTPTPEAPVELVSAGASGAIKTTVAGKNLFDEIAWYSENGFVQQSDGSWFRSQLSKVCFVNTSKKSGPIYLALTAKTDATTDPMYLAIHYTDGVVDGSISMKQSSDFVTRKHSTDPNKTVDYIKWTYGGAGTYYIKDVMISFVGGEYEPYNAQTITASTPNGLPGIPVSSGGNYTDENGQAWVCDEIDFVRGVHVKRTDKIDMGTMNWAKKVDGVFYSWDLNGIIGNINVLCNRYVFGSRNEVYERPQKDKAVCTSETLSSCFIGLADSAYTDQNALKAALSGATLMYALATPIETALSAEELAAYAALHSNKPNTTVYNDAGAGLSIEYVADTKNYIDNKFTELQNAILSAGANI